MMYRHVLWKMFTIVTLVLVTGLYNDVAAADTTDGIDTNDSNEIRNDADINNSVNSVNGNGYDNTTLEKLPSRKGWEYGVSGPIWAAISPVILFFKGIGGSIFISEAYDLGIAVYNVLVSSDKTRIIFPTYTNRTGFGIVYQKSELVSTSSELNLQASYGSYNRRKFEASFTDVYPFENTLHFDAEVYSTYLPDEPFYGIGNSTDKDSKTEYADLTNSGSISFGYFPVRPLLFYARPGVAFTRTSDSPLDDEPSTDSVFPSLPGVNSSVYYSMAEAGIVFDNRDADFLVSEGIVSNAHAGITSEFGTGTPQERDPFRFMYFGADLNIAIETPWSENRFFLLRTDLQIKRSFDGADIPYYMLSTLGSDQKMNGFQRRRFVDNDRLIASVGYRYPVWWFSKARIDNSLILDVGQVAENIVADFSWQRFQPGFGIGLRLLTPTQAFGSLILGISNQAVTVRVSLLK